MLDLILLIFLIFGAIATFKADHKYIQSMEQQYPKLKYLQHSAKQTVLWDNLDTTGLYNEISSALWRWHLPEDLLGFKVQDTPESSILSIPASPNKFFINLSYMVSFIPVLLFIFLPYDKFFLVLSGVFLLVGWNIRYSLIRLVQIELRPDTVVFVTCCRIFMNRFCYAHSHTIEFEGRYVLFNGANTFRGKELETKLLFELKVLQWPDCFWCLFWRNRRFLTGLTQSQGSWIIGGLQHWMQRGASVNRF